MDDTVEAPLTRGPEDSEPRGSRDPVAHPVETSIAQTAPDSVFLSDGLVVPIGPNPAEMNARAHDTNFRTWKLLRASQSCGRTTQRARVPDHHGSGSCNRLAVNCSRSWTWDVALGNGSNQCGASYLRSLGGGRTLASLGTEEAVIFRIDGEPAIRALAALRFNTLGAKRLSSSVDQSIPLHQWVWLRT